MSKLAAGPCKWCGGALVVTLLLFGCSPTRNAADLPDVEAITDESETPAVRLPDNARSLVEIVRSLAAKGYDPVVDIELDNDRWEIDAFRDGHRVEVLVDAVSGEIVEPEPPASGIPLAEILANLEEMGFDPVLEVRREADGWEIEAYRSGEAFIVIVDPATGKLIEEE